MNKLSKTFKHKIDHDPGKALTSKWHFMKRMIERLKIKLSEEDYEYIVASIKNTRSCSLCDIRYISAQSNRLSVYELTFPNYEPVNVIYDKTRKSLVTVLFKTEGKEIAYYYDIFNNKISVKFDLGYNIPWRLNDTELQIPSETVVYNDNVWEVTSEGILKDKRFTFDGYNLIETM